MAVADLVATFNCLHVVTRYRGQLGVNLNSCKRGKGPDQFVTRHTKRGGITCHTRYCLRQLLERGYTVFGRQLYLILYTGCDTPLQPVVFDKRGGDTDNLVYIGDAAHGAACRGF